ncbi:MAG TPA: heparan-alpha-glucosaminide N-acetyltransferase domain-containing protein [Polyangia bacterium]|jgi:uncharacterized membrane protein|nr:heparan-alpha-glucosaminide N-acetyltransferase domain-containing protein [Polyangia bacterium]
MATPTPPATASRLVAIDQLRGLVMMLMTIDHAGGAYNAGHLVTDAAGMYRPGTALPLGQFLTRWITHLCAPTFVFLAGVALSLSVTRRLRAGESGRNIDRFIATRGLLLILLEPLWVSLFFVPGNVLFQVLYAIGMSFLFMMALRRVSTGWLLGLGLGITVFAEALAGLLRGVSGGLPLGLPAGLLLTGGFFFRHLIIGYPVLPWLSLMLLGWALGRHLGEGRPLRPLPVAATGAALLGVFALMRGLNQYGNYRLLRDDASLVQWLHVSKYPPSLTFITLELGLSALCLAVLLALGRRGLGESAPLRVLRTFGQTALFFYLLHIPLLFLPAYALGLQHRYGLGATYLATGLALIVLYPLCRRYRAYKTAHPSGWTRYV